LGALSWIVTKGYAGETDLADMRVVLASRYHDHEPRSPWTFALFVDARGEPDQRQAIADIFTGRLGGTPRKQFPWVFKDSDLLGVEAVDIEIDHTPGRGWFRASGKVEVRMRGPVADQGTVTCMIPGHHRRGRELFTESLDVDTGSLVFSVQGRCAYETSFEYSSDDG
jgi:hypothetical protein